MAKFGKWLGGGLGWALGGPVGAILGFAIGSFLDESNVTVQTSRSGNLPPQLNVNDFTASLLVLSAAVMKSDGTPTRSELNFIHDFFKRQFGPEKAGQSMLMLREILKQNIPVHDVCHQIRQFMPLASRLQLIHYLYGLSNADGQLHQLEISSIEQIGHYLGIPPADMSSIKAMYYRDAESDYKILEIAADVTDEEVKKAYRRMAIRYHPDKVAQEGEAVQKAATEKFKRLQEAYDNIRRKRGMA